VLGLFGIGWDQQRYRFLSSGTLKLSWEKACQHATTR
jgi:endoglucanase